MDNEAHPVCIDALLGPKARAMGARCPCALHTPRVPIEEKANAAFTEASQTPPEPEPPNVTRKPHNGKMAAANDQEDDQ